MHSNLKSNWFSRITAPTLVLAALVAGSYALPDADAQQKPAAQRHAENLSAAFRSAANEAKPAVVKIVTRTKSRTVQRNMSNPFRGSPFEDFFGGQFGFDSESPFQWEIPGREGVGSGVVIDPDGVILTNNHVVENADRVTVQLPDGRQFDATDIRTDPQTDLAVIRIESDESLPAARLGDSDVLDTGDWVIAIGTPFQYDQTVTAGIISGTGRQIGGIQRAPFLQTDAAINPGNSGGPLVNLDGEVVGINTAIATNTGGYQGLGFAIPVNLAKWVVPQLLDEGKVERAWLGVGIGSVGSDSAEAFGVDSRYGALVSQVFEGSPAAEAGLEPGDIIKSFNGQEIQTTIDLTNVVERTPMGKAVPVEVIRDGKLQRFSVVLKPLKEDIPASQDSPSRSRETGRHDVEDLGFSVTEFSSAPRDGAGANGEGVRVAYVDPSGPAAEAGLRRGMTILRVRRQPVNTIDEFVKAIEQERQKEYTVLLVSVDGVGQRFVTIPNS